MKQMRLTFAAVLLAVAAICSGGNGAAALPSADEAPLRIALQDFAARPDSVQYNRDNPEAYVSIAPQTESTADRSYDGMYYAFAAEEVPSAAKSLVTNFLQRNRRSYLTKSLDLKEPALRISAQEVDEDPLKAAKSSVRTYVHLKAPGYSPDGNVALVWFQFRWSIHGAYAIYLLVRSGDQWVIKTHAFRYLV